MRMYFFSLLSVLTLCFTSCGMKTFFHTWGDTQLKKMEHTVQVGAFSRMRYAVSLEKKLRYWGMDAFHFRHADGLYKVRFGNYRTYVQAKNEALRIRREGLIEDFFVVRPNAYAIARLKQGPDKSPKFQNKKNNQPAADKRRYLRAVGKQSTPSDNSKIFDTAGPSNEYTLNDLRRDLIKTARRFLGTPYRWGGSSADSGFDCSGLTLTVYRLNGFSLPRNAAAQMQAGKPIPEEALKPGDLVFFDTAGQGTVSHVGIYHGNGTFIHAPRHGKSVEITRMDRGYFKKTYRGGRKYF